MRTQGYQLAGVLAALFLFAAIPLAAGASGAQQASQGRVYNPELEITEPIPGPNHAEALIEGKGFHANETVYVTLTPPPRPDGTVPPPWTVTTVTGANGKFSLTLGVYMYCGLVPVEATDSSGATATGSFTVAC